MESKNKNWWDGLSEEDIQRLKANEKPYGLLPASDRKILDEIRKEGHLEVYHGMCEGWKPAAADCFNCAHLAYRLRPLWQPPTKKEGHWEYCEVMTGSSEWFYR